jgi:hypothetical protein
MENTRKESKIPSQQALSPKLYDEAIQAELQKLKSDTELLFQQLQSLSRQRVTQSGMAQ